MGSCERWSGSGYFPDYKEFYETCNGVTIADVHGGYFLHSLEIIVRNFNGGEPVRIAGLSAGDILVFGSDGTGRSFAVYADERQEVIYLKEGRVEISTYYERPGQVEIVADDFCQFLDRLLGDVKAFINDDVNWNNLVG